MWKYQSVERAGVPGSDPASENDPATTHIGESEPSENDRPTPKDAPRSPSRSPSRSAGRPAHASRRVASPEALGASRHNWFGSINDPMDGPTSDDVA